MKKFMLVMCLLMVGCATAPRDNMAGLPQEIRQAMASNPILNAAGNRNGGGYRYGSPERGFLNVNSNRGYTGTEYNGTDGHGWSIRTSNGRVTSWSIH
jgi:hypothetical protein